MGPSPQDQANFLATEEFHPYYHIPSYVDLNQVCTRWLELHKVSCLQAVAGAGAAAGVPAVAPDPAVSKLGVENVDTFQTCP